MNTEILNQTYLFAIYFICGVIIGIFFDLFRILRKSFKTPDIITYIEDIIFGILTGIFLIFIIFVFNNGELRFYIFLALILGLSIYLLTISKYFIKFNVKILTTIKKIFIKIFSLILYPIKILKDFIIKLVLKPFKISIININNILNTKKAKIKTKKVKKSKKNGNNKKDFSK